MKTTKKEIMDILSENLTNVTNHSDRIGIYGVVYHEELKALIQLVEKNGDSIYLTGKGYLIIHN